MAVLDSDRYFALLDTLEQPVQTIADAPALEEIRAAEHKRLRKAVKTLDDASADEELHAVRIHVKRARYAAELSGAGAYVTAAKALRMCSASARMRLSRPSGCVVSRRGCRTPPSRRGGSSSASTCGQSGDATSGGRRGRS